MASLNSEFYMFFVLPYFLIFLILSGRWKGIFEMKTLIKKCGFILKFQVELIRFEGND